MGLFSPGSPTSWFVCEDGKTEGPLREQRIVQLIQWGKISSRAYVCDEQLSSWVSIRRTAFAALLAQSPRATEPAEAEVANRLGALRGGPWRLSTRAAQRLSGRRCVATGERAHHEQQPERRAARGRSGRAGWRRLHALSAFERTLRRRCCLWRA